MQKKLLATLDIKKEVSVDQSRLVCGINLSAAMTIFSHIINI